MARRQLSNGYNKHNFTYKADRTKAINTFIPTVMRGGYRL